MPIYLLGDSHAQHFSEAVIAAGLKTDRPVVVATASACPYVDIHLTDADAIGAGDRCDAAKAVTTRYLSSARRGTVVLAATDIYWSDDRFAVTRKAVGPTRDPELKATLAREGLAAFVHSLRSAGHSVLLVHSVPRWDRLGGWDPRQCSTVAVIGPGDCSRRVSLTSLERSQGLGRDLLNRVAADEGVEVLDPRAELCPEATCSTHQNGIPVYRDASHITAAQSSRMAEMFAEALNRATTR